MNFNVYPEVYFVVSKLNLLELNIAQCKDSLANKETISAIHSDQRADDQKQIKMASHN